jgi:hypothetical protein
MAIGRNGKEQTPNYAFTPNETAASYVETLVSLLCHLDSPF